mgnify:CR=1 FL=1
MQETFAPGTPKAADSALRFKPDAGVAPLWPHAWRGLDSPKTNLAKQQGQGFTLRGFTHEWLNSKTFKRLDIMAISPPSIFFFFKLVRSLYKVVMKMGASCSYGKAKWLIRDSQRFDEEMFDSGMFDSETFDSGLFGTEVFDSEMIDVVIFDSELLDSDMLEMFDSELLDPEIFGSQCLTHKWLTQKCLTQKRLNQKCFTEKCLVRKCLTRKCLGPGASGAGADYKADGAPGVPATSAGE